MGSLIFKFKITLLVSKKNKYIIHIYYYFCLGFYIANFIIDILEKVANENSTLLKKVEFLVLKIKL